MDKTFIFGLGVTIIFGLLPYAVKNLHPAIISSGILVGVILMAWAITPDNQRFILFIIGGMLLVGFAGWGLYSSFFGNLKNPLDETILIECERGKLPDVIPNDGIIHFIQINSPSAPQSANLGKLPGKPGEKYNNWPVKENETYRCRVQNYGDKPIFHVGMTFIVEFRDVEKLDNGIRSGNTIKHIAEYPLVIPDIDAGGKFEFYIYNLSQFYPRVLLPKSTDLKQLGCDKIQSVKLRHAFMTAFFLSPHVYLNKTKK